MTTQHPVVFLVDVDNTLLDNDRVTADLRRFLDRRDRRERPGAILAIFEELRAELGYADYLGDARSATALSSRATRAS